MGKFASLSQDFTTSALLYGYSENKLVIHPAYDKDSHCLEKGDTSLNLSQK